MVAVIGAIGVATVAIINAIHGVQTVEQLHHTETAAKLDVVQSTVNGNTSRLIEKIPDPPK